MRQKNRPVSAFRYAGLLGIVLLGFVAIIGSGGGSSKGKYLISGKLIKEAPPPSTASPSAPVIFDLSVSSTVGVNITFSVSFTDIEADATTFCIAFDDQPKKYYAYDVKEDAYGHTSYRLSVTDSINIFTPGTYCFTVFLQDEAGNTSNKISNCFAVECEECEEDCTPGCSNGAMTIAGTLDGGPIDFSGKACARKGDDIEVGLFFCNGTYIGLEIKEVDKLASDTTYAVNPYEGGERMPDDFPIKIVRFKPENWEQSASSGTFSVTTYNDNTLIATYKLIMPDGGEVSGEMNIWSFQENGLGD